MDTLKKNILTFRSSRLHSMQVLCTTALFVALYTALSAVNISLSPTLRISFSFLALAASCYYFGMFPNIIAAFACDLLGWLIHPDGGYVPFFALILIVKAIIYSISFYQKEKVSLLRTAITQLVVVVLCNILLNPLLLSVMYQMPYWSVALSRILKNAVLFPIETLALYMVLRMCAQIRQRKASLRLED